MLWSLVGLKIKIALGAATLLIIAAPAGLWWYQYDTAKKTNAHLEELKTVQTQQAETLAIVADQLTAAQKTTTDLTNALSGRIEAVQSQVGGITGTVSTLEKLTKTDPELLQKYSKVFFLNDNYAPARLSQIDTQYTYDDSRPHQFHTQALPYLISMMTAAKAQGLTLEVKSAYRSFEEQYNIKSGYKVTYGAGTANTFSADQGYSEHQLGTAVDFTTPELKGALEGFDKTPAYAWMREHAKNYGFILSYPPNNAYYIFEPWHWRFVGKKLARDLYLQNKNFYDFDQRQIDEYLVTIFD